MATVDIHAHFVPVGLPDMADRLGDARWPVLRIGTTPEIIQHGRRYRAADRSYFDVDERLRVLDELGIATQILSPLPVMLPFWAEPSVAIDYCRIYNELLVAAVACHPDRFRAFGIVPLQDPDLAVREVERAKAAGLAGLEFGTWLGEQRRLADPGGGDVLSAAAEAGLAVLLHPNHPNTFGCTISPMIELGIGVGCETARAVAELHLAGTLVDQPNLRLCLSHGGGAFLWLWPRFSAVLGRADRSPDLPSCLYVDTAGLNRLHVDYLDAQLPPDRVLLGTDLPAIGSGRIRSLFDDIGPARIAAAGASCRDFLDGPLHEHHRG